MRTILWTSDVHRVLAGFLAIAWLGCTLFRMNKDTMEKGEFDAVKGDVKKLFIDVGSWISATSTEMREKWSETKPILEEKLARAEDEARHYAGASAGAAGEMGKGFAAAFAELKNAYGDARTHFERPAEAVEASTEKEEEHE